MLLHGRLIWASSQVVGGRVKLHLKVDSIVIRESRIIENGLRSKLGEPRCNIECVDWLLKTTALRIRDELVRDGMIPRDRVILIDQ